MTVYSVVTNQPWYTGYPVAYGEWNVTYPACGVTGWECPKCHFIYGPSQLVCFDCNSKQEAKNLDAEESEKDNA